MKKHFTLTIWAFVFFSLTVFHTDINAQNVYIPDPVFKNALLMDIAINPNMDGEIDSAEAIAYTGGIYVSEYGINDLTGIEVFVNLTYLDCGSNNISSLDVSNNIQLTGLSCYGNFLTSLDVSNNPLLTTLDCGGNFISALDLSANTVITDLYCNNNGLTNLTLPSGNTLTNVYCVYNELTSLDVSSCTGLQYLTCNNNELSCLDLTSNTALLQLDCSSNQLNGINLMNGNNTSITFYNSFNNPNLYCIQVDDAAYSGSNWFNIDPIASFNTNCGIPTADFNSSAPVCTGTPVVFANTSWNYVFSFWDFGDGTTSTSQNGIHTYDSAGTYTATLISGNCFGSDTISYVIAQGVDIHGHVSYSGGDVTDGVAVLFPYETYYVSFDTVDIVPLDGSGNFFFPNVPQGDYLIKIFADTITYPDMIPTYSYSEWAWDSAAVVLHGCVYNDTAYVMMIELPAPSTGTGLLHGVVVEGPGFGRAQGDPIHGVDIKLGITGSATIVASTTTDTNGEYFFGSLPFGNYTIYADIPGLERDSSYQITLDATNDQFLNLDYMVDSNSVYIVQGIGIENYYAPDNSDLNVYPNPVRDNTLIRYTTTTDSKVKLEIYNIYGVMIQSLVDADLPGGEYTYTYNPTTNNLKSGVYFITLTVDVKSRSLRIVVME